MDDATLTNVEGTLPVPQGETPVNPDPEVDKFDAAELSPHSMDAELVPSAPTGDIVPDVNTQHQLDPANQPKDESGPQVQTPVQS